MGMTLKVATKHVIETSDSIGGLHGYMDCDGFASRLDEYLSQVGGYNLDCESAKEGSMEFETKRKYLQEVLDYPEEDFDLELAEITLEQLHKDKEIIESLIKLSDQSDEWVHIYCF